MNSGDLRHQSLRVQNLRIRQLLNTNILHAPEPNKKI